MISRSSWCAQMPRWVVLRMAPSGGDPSGTNTSAPSACRERTSLARFMSLLVGLDGRKTRGCDGLADPTVGFVGKMNLDAVGELGCLLADHLPGLLEDD